LFKKEDGGQAFPSLAMTIRAIPAKQPTADLQTIDRERLGGAALMEL
jgi:hypothetical protein